MPEPVIETQPLAMTSFNRQRAAGHQRRLGHALQAVQVTADRVLWHTVSTCCGHPIPDQVNTWADTIPARPERVG